MNPWLDAFIQAGGDKHIVTLSPHAKNDKIAKTLSDPSHFGNYGKFGAYRDNIKGKDTGYILATNLNGKAPYHLPPPQTAETQLWRSEDWQYFYNERAGILEHEGKHPRQEANRIAYETCIVRWMNENPPVTNPDTCPQCNHPIIIQTNNTTPVLKKGGHIWLHDKCHPGWMQRRRQEAEIALKNLGVTGDNNE